MSRAAIPVRGWVCALAAGAAMLAGGGVWAQEESFEVSVVEEGVETAVRRDPFWPVGYAPRSAADIAAEEAAAAAAAAEAQEAVAEEQKAAVAEQAAKVVWPPLPVRGRSRAPDGTYRVLIVGVGIVGENRIVSIRHQEYWFYWRIVSIDERGVQSKKLGISKKRSSGKELIKRKERKP